MKYFNINEMIKSDTAEKYNIDNTPSEEIKSNIRSFIDTVLDPIRESYGSPIYINSGYRCSDLNKKVGGAEKSGHLYGFCCDMRVKNSKDIDAFGKWLGKYLEERHIKYDELIFEKSGQTKWIHFSWIGEGGRQRMKCFSLNV